MGIITPGVNGTLKSTSIENMLYEALCIAVNWENDKGKNPNEEKKITLNESKSDKRVTANFDFKVKREKTNTGSTSFPVDCQLVSTNYLVGSGTTGVGGATIPPSIVSTNIYGAIVELCEEVQRRDADQLKNPQGLNTVTSLSYDSETLTVSGSVTLVIDFSTDNTGNVITRARAYLLD